jgi:hypothetical protein
MQHQDEDPTPPKQSGNLEIYDESQGSIRRLVIYPYGKAWYTGGIWIEAQRDEHFRPLKKLQIRTQIGLPDVMDAAKAMRYGYALILAAQIVNRAPQWDRIPEQCRDIVVVFLGGTIADYCRWSQRQ